LYSIRLKDYGFLLLPPARRFTMHVVLGSAVFTSRLARSRRHIHIKESHRPSLMIATLVSMCWLFVTGVRGYRYLRQFIAGLDYLALSLGLFVVALLSSLTKSGILRRRPKLSEPAP
jgi:hypothetical protein